MMHKTITSLLLIGVIFTNYINAQCLNQVTHLSGTSEVNGVNITVTSSGVIGTNTVYCPEVTEPYYIGGISNDGNYTFMFSPAVDSVTLNFSAINNVPNKEIVKLYVNGLNYQIPSAGSLNDCDSLAILTPAGNITGCISCSNYGSGWQGTTISGPISSLTVADSVVSGTPTGALFSLYICNSITTGTYETDLFKLNVFPNPADDLLIIEGGNLHTANITMINLLGQKTVIDPIIQSNQILVDCSDLSAGIYYILIERNGLMETRKVVIE